MSILSSTEPIEIELKDLKRHLEVISRTGKIIFGFRQSKLAVLNRKAKLVILSRDCPPSLEREIKIVCKMSATPYLKSNASSRELSYMAGKPFTSAVISIVDFGSSNLLEQITGTQEQF
ncbi:MAG: ribosomal L7Ae/L30e/S12e/Gadd45 family protein [Nitrososphaerota archaeon]